ncbi:cell division protein FtsZ [Nonlabens spongiae]|uniref:Cell division protein FtsZ n=1 Tax=Nonlabens spongiae TaxID=331648 RepID=A0A1W6MMD1_9FLAO|nr:cell division protein FtsZ [Nonlabens spongiae]ARN78755.1 cell division protein FtsZ [Nonlabens spongiae]
MSQDDQDSIIFDLPKNTSNVIKVIGVGGGGSNAIKHMFQQGINGVDFVICNTDSQALNNSPIPNKVQLGVTLTEGLGAGANPEVGERAARESIEEVRALLDTTTKMVFITAGMGGGTGTGAAPVIAEIAQEMDILTVGIVTTPFQFEGKVRNEQAQKGIEKFRQHVDSLIIINNNKLREVYGNLGFKAGFSKADEVLATASKGIAEVITNHYVQNIDLRDAKTVLSNSGTAIMGSSQASGSNRAQEGILKALDSPLLNDNKITGAKNVLLLIVSGGDEITIDEIGEINEHIQNEAGHSANIIMGVGEDESLGDAIAITVIATGFNIEQQHEISNTDSKRIIHTLEEEQRTTKVLSDSNEKVTPGRLIMDLEEDEEVDENDAFAKADKQKSPSQQKVIVHELGEEEEETLPKPTPNNDLIKTSEEIKDIEIKDEEYVDPAGTLFTITDEDEVQEPVVNEEKETPFSLDFDMPLSQEKEQPAQEERPIKHNLEDIEIRNAEELPNKVEPSGVKKYSLQDFMEDEEDEPFVSQRKEPTKVSEPEIKIVKKPQVKADPLTTPLDPVEPIADPTELPINEAILRRAEERKRKLHLYNYKFKSSDKLDEMERQPAYKRQGVELDSMPEDQVKSRTSISTDENNQLKFKSNNNSYLHDRAD